MQKILVRKEKSPFPKLKFALISDIHLGLFKGKQFAEKIVEILNDLNPDLVLIAGDFVYKANPKKIDGLFSAFKNIKADIYGVFGNHDTKPCGEFEAEFLKKTLAKCGVKILNNEHLALPKYGIRLLGLGELWNADCKTEIFLKCPDDLPILTLVHNPDAAFLLPELPYPQSTLILAGHTHGGQVRLPLLEMIPHFYRMIIPTKHAFDRAWHEHPRGRIFVSSGLGESLLPLRYGVAPEIVLFEKN